MENSTEDKLLVFFVWLFIFLLIGGFFTWIFTSFSIWVGIFLIALIVIRTIISDLGENIEEKDEAYLKDRKRNESVLQSWLEYSDDRDRV